jgi:photosystem II stability/assembly factor-like uncharacterized protein
MPLRTVRFLTFSLLTAVLPVVVVGQDKPDEPAVNASTVSALEFRSIGPALMSGRVADLAIDPVKPNTWYVAVGSGNAWKTENAGTTWQPIFENYSSYSIGCITIDPNDRHTIWIGTGENVSGRHVGYGDGVYMSRDGGKTFQNMGLKESEHISKIVVDPRNSQVVYVAAQGPLWSSGGERGLFKSTNGGKTWKCILSKGPWTGVTDVVIDSANPDILYAATHQRHRTVWGLIDGGPESGIFKSTDSGVSWTELQNGLPGEDKGKMSIAISPQNSDVLYAAIELAGRKGGVWRSANAGASWKKMSDYVAGGTGPHYYQEIYCDPHRFDVFYHANVRLGRTTDGGATFESVSSPHKHVDNHAVAFHPTDPDFLLIGCDGGIYRSWDHAATYQFVANLPVTQFYKVDVDYDEPFYHVVGGTQDNCSQYGPTQTKNSSGIRNADWRITIGGDGHDCAIDPEDPDIIYCESQQGYLRRFDRRTGESIDIRPQPEAGQEELRFNWDAPILISPHSHTRLYFGSQMLHRSDDRGDSWQTISPDLSRNKDRFTLPHMDRVWSIDAMWDLFAMSQYGNITSISESPIQEGLIYVGTDDGLIQVTEDGGQNWRKIDKVYGIPEGSFVNDIKADIHDVDTVYAIFDNHKQGDFAPYLVRSTDRGQHWESINGDLPDRHIVWRIIQDHVVKELLFIGTEFGVFYTRDAGQHWIKLAGTPTIPFRDLEIQRRENDLVGASFGRGFFVLDDYTPLRTIDAGLLNRDFAFFDTPKAKLYIVDNVLGGEKGSQGNSYFTAPNPPFGAVFTYYLKDGVKTRKQKRQEEEGKRKEKGEDNTYPGWDQLKLEQREQSPQMIFTIRDASNQVVNRITGPISSGIHRITWNLRYASFTGGSGSGPLVTPGTYTVSAERRTDEKTESLGEPMSFEVVSIIEPALPRQDRQQVLQFQTRVGKLQRQVVGATRKIEDVIAALETIERVVANTPTVDSQLRDRAHDLLLQLQQIQEEFTGDELRADHSQLTKVPIMSRVQTALRGTLQQTYGPTKTHREQYDIGAKHFKKVRGELDQLLKKQYAPLLKDLDKAGVPWTPGRPLPPAP